MLLLVVLLVVGVTEAFSFHPYVYRDIATIGPYVQYDPQGREYFQPRPASPQNDWAYEVDPDFPAAFRVSQFFFRNNDTHEMGTCVRTIGGRIVISGEVVRPTPASSFETRFQKTKFSDTYYCFARNSSTTNTDPFQSYVRMSAFINNFKPAQNDPFVHSPGGVLLSGIDEGGFPLPGLQSGILRDSDSRWTDKVAAAELSWARTIRDRDESCSNPDKSSFCLIPTDGAGFSQSVAGCHTMLNLGSNSVPTELFTTFDSSLNRIYRNDFSVGHYCLQENSGSNDDFISGTDKCTDALSPADCLYRISAWINFQTNCVITGDRYTVGCFTPVKYEELAAKIYVTDGTNPSNRKGVINRVKGAGVGLDSSWHTLLSHGVFQYMSFGGSDLLYFLDGKSRLPDDIAIPARISRYSNFQPSNASIWSVYHAHITTGSNIVDFFSPLSSGKWNDEWRAVLGRKRNEDAFFMDCPIAAGNGSECNWGDENGNYCHAQTGRCFCDPHWLGIACDIPWPTKSDGSRLPYNELLDASGSSDPYQLCSTAGVLSTDAVTVNLPGGITYTNVRYCQCMSGFEGTVDHLRDMVIVYGSLFHSVMLYRHVIRRGGGDDKAFNYEEVFDFHATGEDFRNRFNVGVWDEDLQFRDETASPKRGIAFDWYEFMMVHQCLIYTPSANEPPSDRGLWFDYFGTYYVFQANGGVFYYNNQRSIYPWPSISTTTRNAPHLNPNATGKQGIRCMDFKEGGRDWDTLATGNADVKEYPVAHFVQYLRGRITNPATLYGGPLCTPCPDCNREHSVCISPGRNQGNVCACDDNYCGPTCDTPRCPMVGNTQCGVNGTCRGGTLSDCVADPITHYAGHCECVAGWTGPTCSDAVCPFFSRFNGVMCGNGTCDLTTGRCSCNAGSGGDACDLVGCPLVNSAECNGAKRVDNGETVCNRDTGLCECFRTLPLDEAIDNSVKGWGQGTKLGIHLRAKYGRNCEFDYAKACLDPGTSDMWCGQKFDTNTGLAIGVSPSYAGCYNNSQLPGHMNTPYCHCALEFAMSSDQHCARSLCGNERCGVGGVCDVDCFVPGTTTQESNCEVLDILGNKVTVTPRCQCLVVNGTYYYHRNPDANGIEACTDPAPICYTPPNSPCNGHGRCAYNSSSDSHFCACNTGYTGTNCSVAPECLTPQTGSPCTGSLRACSYPNGHNHAAVCECAHNYYFRDADRTCTTERCVATNGVVGADDNCDCPESRPFYSDPPLNRAELNHVALGCRKGCPFRDGVPCGATEAPYNRSRCSDLLANDPIFWDDSRPAPTCNCSFRGHDRLGKLNYFVSDGLGGCRPQCNPDGLCAHDCSGASGASLNTDNSCNCAPGYTGQYCDTPVCDYLISHHIGNGICSCMNWCHVGPQCSIDVCALSGGVCASNDCDCSGNPALKLNTNTTAQSRRNCTSACVNGGVRSGSICVCPAPYFGVLCELTVGSCNVQYSGTHCDVSTCQNGGTPLPQGQNGCTCLDSFYQGALCDRDLCQNVRNRTSPGVCECGTGFSGDDCSEDRCRPGGYTDLVSRLCICDQAGWEVLNGTACVPTTTPCSIHGIGKSCSCASGWTGVDCNTPVVCDHANQVPVGDTCECAPGTYGDDCSEDPCNDFASGYNLSTGGCVCMNGYARDSNGQCVYNPYYCDFHGTEGWSADSTNTIPCSCKAGFTGVSCSSYVGVAAPSSSSSSSFLGLSFVSWLIIGGAIVILIAMTGLFWLVRRHLTNPPSAVTMLQTQAPHRRKKYSRLREVEIADDDE